MRADDELERLPHIGPARAARLRRALGADLIPMLDAAPERVLGTLHGVGPAQAREGAECWRALRLIHPRRGSAPRPRG
ncbi:MAG: hypothetical protein M3P44_11780 [Actinomycetota bacterium]|nr:hypothetical protein [Actinomycetota bacterium]